MKVVLYIQVTRQGQFNNDSFEQEQANGWLICRYHLAKLPWNKFTIGNEQLWTCLETE